MDLTVLKDFADFGGVFILFLVFLLNFNKKIDGIEEKLIKILTLLTVTVKATSRFNHVEEVLGDDGDKVAGRIIDAEKKKKSLLVKPGS